ncbi:MAG: hypothetical protein JJE47_02955 [Acidimicrobiia bacterium]|nr:hypothetical protein [Acidimicrobiia bacterium]
MNTGKRALFEAPSTDEHHRAPGKDALFSGADPRGIRIECSRCGATTSTDLLDVVARISWFSAWIPGKKYSRWIICPACHERAWVRLRWLD